MTIENKLRAAIAMDLSHSERTVRKDGTISWDGRQFEAAVYEQVRRWSCASRFRIEPDVVKIEFCGR